MKKTLPFLMLLLLIGCTTNPKPQAEMLIGEFLYYENAAVLNTGSTIYGVVVDEKLHELHRMVTPIQKDSFDMVQVIVKGIITENTGEGWPQRVRITEIDSVAPSMSLTNQLIEIRTE